MESALGSVKPRQTICLDAPPKRSDPILDRLAFWMLPGSWVIRRYVDYAFDRSLQRKREISSFLQSESVILKSNPTREELLGEFHKFDEGIRELRRSSYVEGYFLDSVTLNMKRLD